MGAAFCKLKTAEITPLDSVQMAQIPKNGAEQTKSSILPNQNQAQPLLEDGEAKKRDQEIEKQLLVDKTKEKSTLKLLLLGTGESGKSTIAKQMKILHSDGFDDTELVNVRCIAQHNILTILDEMVQGIAQLQIKLSDENKEDLETIAMFKSQQQLIFAQLTEEIGAIIKRLWLSPPFQICYENRHKIEVQESAKYFLDSVDRIAADCYLPTSQDALRCRMATTGVHESRFQFRNRLFRLIDVGGQRSERRKWIHCFDDVTAILFIISLSEYNQTLREDHETNRMQESLELFANISTMKVFINTPMILFLNKKDVFEEKIQRYPISDYFPNYQGKLGSYDDGAGFIRNMYQEKNPKGKPFYTHFTNATDTNNVNVVFGACADILVANRFADQGVY